MIANLPLLITNGNPTDLSKVNAEDLEKFITFMVTCSWGHDTAKDIRQPPWWPRDVPFSHPFQRPHPTPQNWTGKLKNLVKKCYDFHKSTFLLVFSAQLSRYPRKRLRYVDNRDSTTSLYYIPSRRLLVTFRNENLNYDQTNFNQGMPQSLDIYLCDNCDSHFDNIYNFRVHERLCNNEDGAVSETTCSGGLPEFLSALKLKAVSDDSEILKSETKESQPRNSRSAANVDRGPPYPFSSLAYMKNAKNNIQRDTNFSRERNERYCSTSDLNSKQIGSKNKNHQFPIRYRRPIDYWHRKQVFPEQRYKEVLDLKGQLYLLKCKPISVNVERMSLQSAQEYIDDLKAKAAKRAKEKDIIFIDGTNFEQPADVEMKNSDPLKRLDIDCEVIDLCSDDEAQTVNENCDPRVGVTCVMKGGAILRRTAATPISLPSEPCGARQRPLSTAILKPHPVILITHSLNNLQTISLD